MSKCVNRMIRVMTFKDEEKDILYYVLLILSALAFIVMAPILLFVFKFYWYIEVSVERIIDKYKMKKALKKGI